MCCRSIAKRYSEMRDDLVQRLDARKFGHLASASGYLRLLMPIVLETICLAATMIASTGDL